jgi:transposase-like protein
MPIQRYKPEQVVTMLRQIEVSIANEASITSQTFYRWRKEHEGLKMDQAKRMKKPDKTAAFPPPSVRQTMGNCCWIPGIQLGW